ncbi:15335_t:CDS:2, partial [Gigaspora margarita]
RNPGDTLPVLKKQINEIEKQSDIKIKICKDTLYCFDNDSFRFLAAIKNGSTYSESSKENYIHSWKKSVNEAVRLFRCIIKCTPHNINDTVSLNNARQTVMIFCESLAEINRNIQENLVKIKELKEEIEKANLTEEELRKKIDQLKERQNTLDKIIIQFTQFLMQNAIAVFNDTYAEYLDYIIHLERENVKNTSNNEILKGLEEIKSKYDENVKIIKTKIENNDASSSLLSSEDIFNLEQQLYSLPDIGQYLQDIKKEEKKAFIYQERHYELSGNISNVFTKIFRM